MKQPIWKLVHLCAQALTERGMTPFTRGDLIRCVQSKNPRYEANSINPIIQGVTDNLRGGAPGAVGKNILHGVGYGLLVLREGISVVQKPPQTEVPHRKIVSGSEEAFHSKRPSGSVARLSGSKKLQLGKYQFKCICSINPETNADGSIRVFMPQSRYDNKAGLSLNRYGTGPFCKFKVPRELDLSGVYAVQVGREVKYIGECKTLSSRYNMGYGNISPRNCFVGGQETNCRINNLILQQAKSGADISLWFLPTNEYKMVERELRGSLSLSWNRV